MRRLLFFILKLAVLLAAAVWLADQPGDVRIVWHDYMVETSAAFLVATVFLVVASSLLAYRVLRFLRHGHRHFRMRQEIRRLQKGHRHVTQGLVALASGEAAEAGRHAVASRKLLGHGPVTQFLQAQAAQLAGDRRTAENIFRAMSTEDEGRAIGYRGLISMALREGKWDEAQRLASQCELARPHMPWLHNVRYELAARRGAWTEAAQALQQSLKAHQIEPRLGRQQQAALCLAEAQSARGAKDTQKALVLAEQAVQHAPDWVPARLELAEAQYEAGHGKLALKTIEKAWAKMPHPDLAALYARMVPEQDKLQILKRVALLGRGNPEDPATLLALAQSAMDANMLGEARRYLAALAAKAPDRQVYRLLAQLEQREKGDRAAASAWLAKAAEAPLEPQWMCESCNGAASVWQPLCPHCGEFNALSWQRPGQSRVDGAVKGNAAGASILLGAGQA